MTKLTQDNLKEVLDENKKVIVQFSAGWCGNCRLMKPRFRKFASETQGLKFVVVDAEKFPESRKLATVDNLPTFATYIDGKLVNQVQTNKHEILKELIDEVTSN